MRRWQTPAITFATLLLLVAHAGVARAGVVGTLTVGPNSVLAGETVEASGTCPSGANVSLYAFLVIGSSPEADEGFTASIRPQPDPAGNWSTSFRIPQETPGGTWQFSLLCTHLDVAYPGPAEVDVQVTATNPVPLKFALHEEPLVAGETTRISGSGCVADGRALDVALVSTVSVAPTNTGEFTADVPIPSDTPSGPATIEVLCRDVSGQSPSFDRVARLDTEIVAGSPRSIPPAQPPWVPPTFTG